MNDTGKLLSRVLLVAVIVLGLVVIQNVRVNRAEQIEHLCYDVSLFRDFSLEGAFSDSGIENPEKIMGLVLNPTDGRSLREVGNSMNKWCYERGAEYL